MPGTSFDYAVIRVVPRVERAEFLNAGVILFCLEKRFLAARVQLDESRLHALDPTADGPWITEHLESLPAICRGDRSAAPISQLTQRERFHWLVAPRSSVIQLSPVHTGLCDDPHQTLNRLFQHFVPATHS